MIGLGEDTGEEREAAPQKGNAERPLVRWPSGDWCGKSYHAEAKCMNCGLMCEMEIEFGRRVPGSYGDGPTCPRCGSRMWATWNTNLLGGSGFNYVPGGYEGLKAAIESESIHAPTAPPQPAPDPQAVDDLAKLLWDADSAAIEDATATKYSGPSWESARDLSRIRWRAMATATIRAIGAREAALSAAVEQFVASTSAEDGSCFLCGQKGNTPKHSCDLAPLYAAITTTPSAASQAMTAFAVAAQEARDVIKNHADVLPPSAQAVADAMDAALTPFIGGGDA